MLHLQVERKLELASCFLPCDPCSLLGWGGGGGGGEGRGGRGGEGEKLGKG